MTREAKIGLLTGLAVIVLIGVLLSEYLGGQTAGAVGASNRMAALPIGAAYREHVMKPIGVPGMGRTEVATSTENTAPAQFPAPAAGELPTAFARGEAGDAGNQAVVSLDPVMASPVTPVRDGQVAAAPLGDSTGVVPIIQVVDRQVISAAAVVGAAPKAAVAGEEYVIAPGDTLAKIAKRFYKSAKAEDEVRIVAANPGSLKNVTTMLIAGKKLLIPYVAAAVRPAAKVEGKGDSRAVVVIRPAGLKGDGGALVPAGDDGRGAGTAAAIKAPVNGSYTVQDGDTLEKIARKLAAGNYQEVAKQIASLNKIKDPRGLQVGMKLRLPAKG